MRFDPETLRQWWPKPSRPRPIVIFSAGSIVGDAHLPAYRKGGFPVAGLFDPDVAKAKALAAQWGIRAFATETEALAVDGAIFDLATPPSAHAAILSKLPRGAFALIQKPMGSDLAGATEILRVCRERDIKAAVNFQLRFAPMMLALKDAVEKGYLGEVVDFDAWLALATPWGPKGVHAKTIGHPNHEVAQTRTAAILDYGDRVRCVLSVNHDHDFGRRFQACEFRISGTKGAAYIKLGVNLDYPRGEPDELWIRPDGGEDWISVPLEGAWFPDAFLNRMANLQRFAAGEDSELAGSVEDGWQTMALVEAAYQSSARPATPLAPLPEA
jgi:predicted dehydrogenase